MPTRYATLFTQALARGLVFASGRRPRMEQVERALREGRSVKALNLEDEARRRQAAHDRAEAEARARAVTRAEALTRPKPPTEEHKVMSAEQPATPNRTEARRRLTEELKAVRARHQAENDKLLAELAAQRPNHFRAHEQGTGVLQAMSLTLQIRHHTLQIVQRRPGAEPTAHLYNNRTRRLERLGAGDRALVLGMHQEAMLKCLDLAARIDLADENPNRDVV